MMHLPYGRTVAKGKLTRSRLDVRLPIDVLTFKCFTEAGGGDSRVFVKAHTYIFAGGSAAS